MVQIVPKGESVQLRGKNAVGNEAVIGLGWNINEGQSAHAFDLDASVIARDANGVAQVVCYFNEPQPAPWISHSGDNLTGEGEGDDEQIKVNLSDVPADIARLDVVVHIYDGANRSQNFGMVEESFVRVAKADAPDTDVLRADLTADELFTETGLHFASLVRNGPTWDFQSVQACTPEHATLESSLNASV